MTTKLEALAEQYRAKAAEFCALQSDAAKLRAQREHIDRERRALIDRIEEAEIQMAKLRHDLLNHALGDELSQRTACDERFER